jgi:hypothetical protein
MLHSRGQRRTRQLDEQVEVIGHLAVRVATPREPLDSAAEQAEPGDVVELVDEDATAVVPARGDVHERAREVAVQPSSGDATLAKVATVHQVSFSAKAQDLVLSHVS